MAKEIVTLVLYKYPYRTVSSPTLRKGKLHKTFHACQEPKERICQYKNNLLSIEDIAGQQFDHFINQMALTIGGESSTRNAKSLTSYKLELGNIFDKEKKHKKRKDLRNMVHCWI